MSVFNCNIMYKRIVGDSYTSTINKLVSQGFLDKKNNIIDVGKFYAANTELSIDASAKLGYEVRLFKTPMRPKGRVAVANREVFNALDVKNKSVQAVVKTVEDEGIPADKALEQQSDNLWNDSPSEKLKVIYSTLNLETGSLLTLEDVNTVRDIIDDFNNLNDRQSLVPIETNVEGKYLINIEYKDNYLYSPEDFVNDEEVFLPQDDNSNFNKTCIF